LSDVRSLEWKLSIVLKYNLILKVLFVPIVEREFFLKSPSVGIPTKKS